MIRISRTRETPHVVTLKVEGILVADWVPVLEGVCASPLAERKAVVRVEFTPGERFVHMIETMFGLAREGHVNAKGMPSPLQLALTAQEFSDVIVFRKPPPRVQRVLFGALTPIARRRGYRATYPSLSRTTLAPRAPHATSD